MKKELLHQDYRKLSPFRTYCRLYQGYFWSFFGCICLFLIKHSPVYVLPVMTAALLNLLTAPQDEEVKRQLFIYGAVAAALILQNIPTHVAFVVHSSRILRSVEKKLRYNLCLRLQHLSIQYYAGNQIGSLQNKVTRDVEAVEQMTRMLVEFIPGFTVSILVALTVTAIRVPQFLPVYLLVIPTCTLIFHYLQGHLADNNQRFRKNIESMSGQVTEMIKLIPITRAHNAENTEINRIETRLGDIQNSGLKLDRTNGLFGALHWTIFTLLNFAVLALAVALTRFGYLKIGVGDVMLLSLYFGQITGAVMMMMGSIPQFYRGLESVKSISEVLECPDIEQNAGKPELNRLEGDFVLDQVTYHYPGQTTPAIQNLSLHLSPGETVALAGPSGSGKSTLAQLLIGFIRPTAGHILIDGHDMNDLDLRSYRRFIAVVTQETLLFDGTIRDNICYGHATPGKDELQKVISDACLDELIASLPDGLDTRIFEAGARLSGGQKQRIAIARALLRDPKLLLLDEATSALDINSERHIQKALDNLLRNRTALIIAHRLSTIRNADRIAVLDQGKLVELGSHDELLKIAGGLYCSMYNTTNDEV